MTNFSNDFDRKMLLISTVITIYSSVDCKPFCRAYRDNADQISYTFRVVIGGQNFNGSTKHEIIIDGLYWSLEFNPRVTSNGIPTLEFINQNLSKENPIFSHKYSMAANVRPEGVTEFGKGKPYLFSVTINRLLFQNFISYSID